MAEKKQWIVDKGRIGQNHGPPRQGDSWATSRQAHSSPDEIFGATASSHPSRSCPMARSSRPPRVLAAEAAGWGDRFMYAPISAELGRASVEPYLT